MKRKKKEESATLSATAPLSEKNLLYKRPWLSISPADDGPALFKTRTQADFLREYYPEGHAINDPRAYPDILREERYDILSPEGEPTGRQGTRIYREQVPRYPFAFQQVIVTKQCAHLCGNDIQFELNTDRRDPVQERVYNTIREGWQSKDMEAAFYKAVRSVKITGDTAFAGYFYDKRFCSRVFSFAGGDTLYPHFNPDGSLRLFARSFTMRGGEYDGGTFLELWDDANFYRLRRLPEGSKTDTSSTPVTGYAVEESKPHGFPFVPVAYFRDDEGPCWSHSQKSIDGYELSFSQMAHNNQAFGEPILLLQSDSDDGIDVQHGLNGSIKTLGMSTDDKASYLSGQSAADSYIKQIDTLYKEIYEQSFAVIPPELKSGDLPAAALRVLYSPAYEKAMADSMLYQSFLNDMVAIFLYGYGLERKMTIDFANCPLKWWIKPYVHTNEAGVVQDLAAATQNGFISRQTASEKISFYAATDEWARITAEKKEEERADLIYMNTGNGNESATDTTGD